MSFSRNSSDKESCKHQYEIGDKWKSLHVPQVLQRHTQNVYRFLNLNMKKIVYSQDVEWMNIMYGEHTGIKCKITCNQDY